MKTREINNLVLAYLGDSIYETYVREYLINKEISHVKDLQAESLKFVTAKSQAKILHDLINQNIFTEEELEIIKRARNTKVNTHPKSCSIADYHEATSFEALLGYLKLEGKEERIEEIIKIIFSR